MFNLEKSHWWFREEIYSHHQHTLTSKSDTPHRDRKQLFSTDCVLCEDMLQPCSLLMSRSNVVINMVLSTTRPRAELFSDWCCYCHHLKQDLSSSSLISSMFLQVEVIGAMIKPAYLIPGRFHWAARPLLLWGCQLWSGIRRTLSPPQRASMSKC